MSIACSVRESVVQQRSKLVFFIALGFATALSTTTGFGEVDFAHEVVPILRLRCIECHSGENKKGGFSLNDRAAALEGSESGKAIDVGNGRGSYLIELVTSDDPDVQMPPQGKRLAEEEIAILTRWIDEGLAWEPGYAFNKQAYEPPLELRQIELPPVVDGRDHPIDRIIDQYLATNQLQRPAKLDDRTFLRRSSLDLIGLLPKLDEVTDFLSDTDPKKSDKWLAKLLADDIGYADHWLSFWNDLLRNDYSGTGFITGGRKQISRWLYESLVENKPFHRWLPSSLHRPPTRAAALSTGSSGEATSVPVKPSRFSFRKVCRRASSVSI